MSDIKNNSNNTDTIEEEKIAASSATNEPDTPQAAPKTPKFPKVPNASKTLRGVPVPPIHCVSNDGFVPGVWGENHSDYGEGVYGSGSYGVIGDSESNVGVCGISMVGSGVHGYSNSGRAVSASSDSNVAVYAFHGEIDGPIWDGDLICEAPNFENSAIIAYNNWYGHDNSRAVIAKSERGIAVEATVPMRDDAQYGIGVYAHRGPGHVVGEPATKDTAIYAYNEGNGQAIVAQSDQGSAIEAIAANGYAGHFKGNVMVTKTIQSQNYGCAELFVTKTTAAIESGTVMVIDTADTVSPSAKAYDKRVAGVVSGAKGANPAIILNKHLAAVQGKLLPLALTGKVYCKVDAGSAAIQIGDLLTTSKTPGHAMKADDPAKAFGAVIGKALRPLAAGKGLIPILVALQ